MEPITPSFTHLPQFVTPQVYAELCGIKMAAVSIRYKRGHIAGVTISGKLFVDKETSPPVGKKQVGTAKAPKARLPLGMPPVSSLVCLDHWTFTNQITANRYYTDILFGRLPAWGFGDHVVVELTPELRKAGQATSRPERRKLRRGQNPV
jgi:hypothetical protein